MHFTSVVRFISIIALCTSLAAHAAELMGRVVGVHDGDTITILDLSKQQHKIRLAGIDAPEGKQPFGARSRQNLVSMVHTRTVTVNWQKRDHYGRIVGQVYAEGSDVGIEQVRSGFAWWYRAYAREQSAKDRKAFAAAEQDARAAKRGLWVDPHAVAPWDWRRLKKAR